MTTQEIINKINDLQNQLDQLKRSNSIPREIETAFAERLGGLNGTGTGSSNTQTRTITTTPQTITIPAQPSGTLNVTYKGVIYKLLYQ